MSSVLLIRADADSRIGVGHVMRCLALAQAWQDSGGEAVFVAAEIPGGLDGRLRQEEIELVRITVPVGGPEDAAATLAVACDQKAAWVVVDGYRFSAQYFDALRQAGVRGLAIDDMGHLERYPVNALLNQNLSATPAVYHGRAGSSTTLLLGPRFSLLRREFRRIPPRPQPGLHEPRRVLVTFGGADHENLTGDVLGNLQRTVRRDLHVIVLAGAANPHVPQLRELAAGMRFSCEVRVDVSNVAELMAWADAAITAGGSTVWELASLGVPALIGAVERNQLMGISALSEVPFFHATPAGELLSSDIGDRLERLWDKQESRSGSGFDALGASRVVDFLRKACDTPVASEIA